MGREFKLFICKECKIKTNKNHCPNCHENLTEFEEIILNDCETKGFRKV
jgi:RNA polymerase subunit RPABC4/transcription elongation factor Spt4